MPATKTTRVHVPMRPVDVARLDHLARRRDVPRAQVIRQAVREYLERESRPQPAGHPS